MRHQMKRFWNKVNKTDSCWEWIAYLDKDGYGKFGYKDKIIRAHRMSWFLEYGEFPNKWLLHTCNNRKCVRVDHLYEGTPKQNTRDSIKIGTYSLGKPKLTDKQKEEIMKKYKLSSLRKLAKEYNVTHGAIQKVLKQARLSQLAEETVLETV